MLTLVWLSDQNIYLQIFEHYMDMDINQLCHRVEKYSLKLAAILDLLAKYWLNHFQNIKNVFLSPNSVRNDLLWIFVGLIDEKI